MMDIQKVIELQSCVTGQHLLALAEMRRQDGVARRRAAFNPQASWAWNVAANQLGAEVSPEHPLEGFWAVMTAAGLYDPSSFYAGTAGL